MIENEWVECYNNTLLPTKLPLCQPYLYHLKLNWEESSFYPNIKKNHGYFHSYGCNYQNAFLRLFPKHIENLHCEITYLVLSLNLHLINQLKQCAFMYPVPLLDRHSV